MRPQVSVVVFEGKGLADVCREPRGQHRQAQDEQRADHGAVAEGDAFVEVDVLAEQQPHDEPGHGREPRDVAERPASSYSACPLPHLPASSLFPPVLSSFLLLFSSSPLFSPLLLLLFLFALPCLPSSASFVLRLLLSLPLPPLFTFWIHLCVEKFVCKK